MMTREEMKHTLSLAANLAKTEDEYNLLKKFGEQHKIEIDDLDHCSPFKNVKQEDNVRTASILLTLVTLIGILFTALYFKVVL